MPTVDITYYEIFFSCVFKNNCFPKAKEALNIFPISRNLWFVYMLDDMSSVELKNTSLGGMAYHGLGSETFFTYHLRFDSLKTMKAMSCEAQGF